MGKDKGRDEAKLANGAVETLTMPNGDVLECEHPEDPDWARSWSIRYADTGMLQTSGERGDEVVDRYGLTAVLGAYRAEIAERDAKN